MDIVPLRDFKRVAKLIRESARYSVYDLAMREHIISMTVLHGRRRTLGHAHPRIEEVYLILEGTGEIQLGKRRSKIRRGDLVMVKPGVFHQVFNQGAKDLVLLSIFKKYPGRGKK
jgi:mannose-6-phosphate isomerase-like protein (cupin superfamily)